ncbi:MAG: proline--tRNA ligase [Desulfovibrionaceae bacterium]|nr:proline--tRNA ligase [Desulfovibrionaceae bacterium]
MFWSRFFLPTLKEAPAEAEVVSHKLMIRAGMIRKLTSGVYNYLPYGLMAINKVCAVVREEMNRAGAVELFMPTVQPADLWRESGRWEHYGKELLRFTDRHQRECCLGPTHEEVITDLVRREVRSYRQLPLNLYQIQTKFRDEIRPRFGLMRGREFLMKDGYSFDRDTSGADKSYQAMYEAYAQSFTRLGLRFRVVEADSGAIGGKFSHEFMVLAQTGEDVIAACSACSYAANLERAEVMPSGRKAADKVSLLEEISTPGAHTVEEVCAFLDIAAKDLLKTVLFKADGRTVAALVRGDREVNEVKIKNHLNASVLELLNPEEVLTVSGAPAGFAGPAGLKADHLLADYELAEKNDWIAGGNKADTHVRHLDLQRDAGVKTYMDLRLVTEEDPCPRCGGRLELPRGIEVGHVFKLGTKYSEAMKAVYLDENGAEKTIVMGTYGIGMSRVVAACIEQNHDADGMILPPAIAPFEVHLLALDGSALDKATELHDWIRRNTGLEVLLDDREERPGVKFKDADLLGAPMQILLGAKSLGRGVVEVKNRRNGAREEWPIENFAAAFTAWKDKILHEWKI